MNQITTIFLMLIATLGPAIVIAKVGSDAVKALGRNPSASPKIFLSMMLSFVFASAVAIIALLVLFIFR